MIKKLFLSTAILTLLLFTASCGGSGSGSTSRPQGVNPGVPSKVTLLDVQNIVQTNSTVFFKARVLDGNGVPVANEPVTFTNLSPFGTLNAVQAVTVAHTDNLGFATATLFSAEPGFATVQAEVNSGVGQVRDRRTVFFTPGSLDLPPFMILDVDGDNDGIYNEPDDFVLLQGEGDAEVLIRATVFDGFGFRVGGTGVLFGADAPYRIGTDDTAPCSDGSTECEVVFPGGVQKFTNSFGEAFVLVRYEPGTLRNIQTLFNVLALADNNAFSVLTLFVEPVFISSVTLSANPTVVDAGGTSTITAAVSTNLNMPAPDGTSVSFTTTCGSVDPFGQTTDGAVDNITFNAPITEGTCTITGTSGGVSGSVSVLVTKDLTISPSTIGVDGSTGAVVPFTISGGIGPYTTTSTDANSAFNDNGAGGGTANDGIKNGTEGGLWTGSSISVTVPVGAPSGSVTLNVQDSDGNTTTATITITGAGVLAVTPSTILNLACGGNAAMYTITGGIPPYTVTSLNPLITISGGPFTSPGDQFTATSAACVGGVGDTDVDILVQDSDAPPSTVTVTITVNDP